MSVVSPRSCFAYSEVVCYTAVFTVVTQRSSCVTTIRLDDTDMILTVSYAFFPSDNFEKSLGRQ